MSNVLVGIAAIILFIAGSLAMATFFGPKFMASRIDAQAVSYLSESSQISHAVESYASDNGGLPVEPGKEPVEILVAENYLSDAPTGGASGWFLAEEDAAILATVEGSRERALDICAAARKKAGFPNPERVYQCDGSDHPNGILSVKDPCCLWGS